MSFSCIRKNCFKLLKTSISLHQYYEKKLLVTNNIGPLLCHTFSNYSTVKPASAVNEDKKDTSKDDASNENNEKDLFGTAIGKYDFFRDDDSPIILDVDEEREMRITHPELFEEKEKEDLFAGMDLKRGISGVFDVEELVNVLKKDNAIDVFVVAIPPEQKYVDYMVFVSGKTPKHMLSMAEYIRKMFKRKRHDYDGIPAIEGKTSNDWIAMDLGNIALHIFSKSAREMYDLETLWAVGPAYDSITNKKDDPVIRLLERHTFLANLNPMDVLEEDNETKNNPAY